MSFYDVKSLAFKILVYNNAIRLYFKLLKE